MIARPELLQAGILGGIAAKRSSIDHQDRFAGVVGEPDVGALEPGKGEGIGGHGVMAGAWAKAGGTRRAGVAKEPASNVRIRLRSVSMAFVGATR